jgi:transposase
MRGAAADGRGSPSAALTGIQFVLRDGLPWQMLQREMGYCSGSTCWRRLVEWERAGAWRRSHETLLAELRRWGRLDQRWTVVDQRVGDEKIGTPGST